MAYVVRIHVTNLDKVMKSFRMFIKNVPTKISREGSLRIAEEVLSYAKYYASQFQWKSEGGIVGTLGIRMTETGAMVSATAPESGLMEYGFKPHWVSAEKHPEIKKWAMEHGVPLHRGKSLFVGKYPMPFQGVGYRPFIRPAVETVRPRIKTLAMASVHRGLIDAGFG